MMYRVKIYRDNKVVASFLEDIISQAVGRAKTVGSNIPFTYIKLWQGLEEYGIAHGSEGAFEAAVIDLIKQMGQSKTVIQLKDTYGNQNAAGFAVPH